MHYFSTTLATNFRPPDWRLRLIRLALFFIPDANPDFESRYPQVRRWLVEVDDTGRVVRELGLDGEGVPVVAAPWGRNYGYWTDVEEPIPEFTREEIDPTIFYEAWKIFCERRASERFR